MYTYIYFRRVIASPESFKGTTHIYTRERSFLYKRIYSPLERELRERNLNYEDEPVIKYEERRQIIFFFKTLDKLASNKDAVFLKGVGALNESAGLSIFVFIFLYSSMVHRFIFTEMQQS